MKPIDILKALGAGAGALALNLLITTAVITAYAMLIAPGHPPAFYEAAAPRIGAWTGPSGGAALLFAAAFILTRRRPERAAIPFALAVGGAYVLIDGALGLAVGGLDLLFAGSMALAMLAVLAGAVLARRTG